MKNILALTVISLIVFSCGKTFKSTAEIEQARLDSIHQVKNDSISQIEKQKKTSPFILKLRT